MTLNLAETRLEAEDAKKAIWGAIIDKWVKDGLENPHMASKEICTTPGCNRPRAESARFCLMCRIERDRRREYG